ncbi:GP-PDE domain-containing protein [Mycena sanguinolenta]|uniref:Autophagy-related protein 2 n=1 Tax=Mycena sanguinolenta TaxID=230812 RepID=A0A8H7D5Y0_9AGAR|nr:GP-PDE domain-containing protein [Mycena sanguinolenta]
MSWFTSWLPGIPSISFALPASIQGRFISFVLKKSLGHLVKPGQLDIDQIDSQIGSGYVQVNDVQLDNQAINSALAGLPVELHEGSISRVTARIPWPNPLTSAVGLSLDSLHLTFHVLPTANDAFPATPNLADSVASVADSFIHDELSKTEEATLRESFHPDLASSMEDNTIPGGLDPFISAPEEEEFRTEADPPGISIFATLIERLLARVEFDAVNTNITLVHPDHTSFSICIPQIVYCTERRPDEPDASQQVEVAAGETRMVTVSGLSVTACNLRPPMRVPSSPVASEASSSTTPAVLSASSVRTVSSKPRSRSVSPASSSSSLDEEVQYSMSQSLAFLPPRSASPASSVASSMYQSAISEVPHPEDEMPHPEPEDEMSSDHTPSPVQVADSPLPPPAPSPPNSEPPEPISLSEVIFSLGDPLVIRLQTPAPHRVEQLRTGEGTTETEAIKLSLEVGVIGCALRAWHLRGAMDLLDTVTISLQSTKPSSSSAHELPSTSSPIQSLGISVQMRMRGVVLIILPAALSGAEPQSMANFFSRPLVPPKLPQSYLRVHLENMSGMFSQQSSTASSNADSFTFSLGDVSAFVFHKSSVEDPVLSASPLLITDHHLCTQYPPSHVHRNSDDSQGTSPLPSFETIDWTDPKHKSVGMKVSHWRTKVRPKSGKSRRESRIEASTSPTAGSTAAVAAQLPPAISVTQKRSVPKQRSPAITAVEVVVEPLQVFLDLDLAASGILGFLDELTDQPLPPTPQQGNDDFSSEDSDEDTPPASPTARRSVKEREKERRRLEKMVLQDLDLDLDYGTTMNKSHPKKSKRRKPQPITTVSIKTEMIRVQIRCLPPPGRLARSGALVLDIHTVEVSTGPTERKNTTRFASPDEPPPINTVEAEPLLSVGCGRIVVACSSVAESKTTGVLSVGSLASGHTEDSELPLIPRITLSRSTAARQSTSTMALVVQIPSVCVHISKPLLDSLQYLADDVAQLAERAFADGNDRRADSQDSSLIGSRYFAKSQSGSTSSGSTARNATHAPKSESVVKVEITEASVRIMLPRESAAPLPFDITASDVDVLVELKPRGKDETVITLAAMGVEIKNATLSGVSETLLSLTAPRGLTSAPKPLLKLSFTSLVVPQTTAKESRIRVALWGFTCNLSPDIQWATDLGLFFKPPPGAFEAVIPTERTHLSLKILDGSIRIVASNHPGALLIHADALDFSTSVDGESPHSTIRLSVPELAVLMIDNLADAVDPDAHDNSGVRFWRKSGFALLTEINDLDFTFTNSRASSSPDTSVLIDRVGLRLHLCADSLTAVTEFANDLVSSFKPVSEHDFILHPKPEPAVVSQSRSHESLMASVDDLAFKKVPQVGPAPDMINDDLPTNPDYLDESFGAAAGLRELRDEDLDDFDVDDNLDIGSQAAGAAGIVSKVGGETIKMLRPEGLRIVEHYFDTLPPDTSHGSSDLGLATTRVRVHNANINVFLYDGYDWAKTRRTIEEQVKEMRRRLAKIRQLVAGGQTQDPSFEETSTVLFNSVYIGLDQDVDGLEPAALIAAIDEELKDDFDTISQSSWQSLRPSTNSNPRSRPAKVHGRRLTRSKAPSIEFQLLSVAAEVDQYRAGEPLVSRTFATVKDLEILDHIKTSTWKKFLTELRSDSRGNVRETDSNMVRVELRSLHPVPGHSSEEARLRAKILPLRLYVDQDALDFLKKFFSFKDPHSAPPAESEPGKGDIYFQLAEIFPVDLKLDYKPRRVDYRALREGRTIELMNFFHFDGAEMTLRHITPSRRWPRLFDMLNDLWTPDVKATQLVDVISGVAPIRSVVNVGSGVADLVLLPIAQYKKDGRIVRGVQKGTTAFFKSTAVEAIKLGARLATGTQVILEQAEDVLGGQFKNPITAETMQPLPGADYGHYGQTGSDEDDEEDLISKYAEQPIDLKEGVQSAYKSLQRNLHSAAQTILAVPMEVYERSGNEGPVRSVIRAVPIAVLKPMIGASEAVSKTLLGLHNTLDPEVRHENEAKYKQR